MLHLRLRLLPVSVLEGISVERLFVGLNRGFFSRFRHADIIFNIERRVL